MRSQGWQRHSQLQYSGAKLLARRHSRKPEGTRPGSGSQLLWGTQGGYFCLNNNPQNWNPLIRFPLGSNVQADCFRVLTTSDQSSGLCFNLSARQNILELPLRNEGLNSMPAYFSWCTQNHILENVLLYLQLWESTFYFLKYGIEGNICSDSLWKA